MFKSDLSKLCVHTITTKPWDLEKAIEKYVSNGIQGISIWRDAIEGKELSFVRSTLERNEMKVVSLVRGGFFTGENLDSRKMSIQDNLKAIEDAAKIGAEMLVLVCGATPGQSLEKSRTQIRDAIEELLPFAENNNVKLAIEPLHPMYADSRSAINTLYQANNLVEYFDSAYVGIALDVYHVWWDPDLEREIIRCGEKNNLFAFHLCDWRVPTRDMLNDRTVMGQGIIDIQEIINFVKNAGYSGYHEVEIFSEQYWSTDQDKYLDIIIKSYLSYTY